MLVAKYKFDKSIYENLIPVFNDGYNGYTVSDEIDSENSNHIIRTIECDILPTLMRFGRVWAEDETDADNRTDSLLKILDMNTSELTNCDSMFRDNTNLTSINCEWDASNVTSMCDMFSKCHKLTSLDLSNFNTSEVTDMQYMFYKCEKLTSLDVSNFNTKNVTIIEGMFQNCTNLTSLDVSNFDTSSVTNMQSMFQNCNKLTSLDVSNFNTSKVTNMSYMFMECLSLTALDLSNWNITNAYMQSIFHTCTKLHTLDLSNWILTSDSPYIFYNCPSLAYIKCNNTDFINSILNSDENSNFPNRTNKSIGKIITTSSTNVDTTTLSSLNWSVDTSSGTKIAEYVYDKSIWNYLVPVFNEGYGGYFVSDKIEDESKPNIVTREIVGYGGLPTQIRFGQLQTHQTNKELSLLELIYLDISACTYFNAIFGNCENLTKINTSNWNTNNITNMYGAFYDCRKLTELDVSNFDTSNVTNMENMFRDCNNLTLLDVSNWNTSKVTNMAATFRGCQSLTSLDVSNFDTNKVIDMRMMFNSTPKLSDIGMLYCSQNTINKLIPLITDGFKTIWVKDTKASDYTATDYVTIKDYKEDNKTLYLNSPLLEGDEIVNKEGKLYHYHKMGKVVLDGSEGWNNHSVGGQNTYSSFWISPSNIGGDANKVYMCDRFKLKGGNKYHADNVFWTNGKVSCGICISNSKLTSPDMSGFKQWLQANPTTIIYELAEPYYELISDDPLIVKSYAEGKLDTSSIITPTSIQSIPYEEELTYLYTSTQYCIQFYSTANCTVDITLGGTKVESKSVSVGLNKIYITTPSTLVDNKLIINAKGNATISKVVVVNSNAEFNYFDGIKSSFEDCLVIDENSENYGKYEVGVKIVGKNKFDGEWKRGYISSTSGGINDSRTDSIRTNFIKIKYNTNYYIQGINIEYASLISFYDKNKNYISRSSGTKRNNYIFKTNNQVQYIIISQYSSDGTNMSLDVALNLQIEEGTTATSYEPYKETNATIYLNSPLLKGDRIEVVDGKLCHYHNMGKVVLDGSEDEEWHEFVIEPGGLGRMMLELNNMYSLKFCNNLSIINWTNSWNTTSNAITLTPLNNNKSFIVPYINVKSIDAFKQWLSENPTTVVYQLAEPYYEDITPIQSSFVISTVSEGDMEIITDLPIKSNITYLTNITSAVLMEQQLDELDNGTESLTNIVEDEINE